MAAIYTALRPLLFRANAEAAHRIGIRLGRLGQRVPPLVRALHRSPKDPTGALRLRAFGLDFENPIGIAAGLDKNAECVPLWTQIGAGFCEVGSVSAKPSAGNPRPRAFRLPKDRALVNRMGLNNEGAKAVAARIGGLGSRRTRPLAINIAKTHDPGILGDAALDDFAESAATLLPHADLVVLNVSCPNTREGKTFEDPSAFAPLVERVVEERTRLGLSTPLLVKFSPPASVDFDPGAIDALIDLARDRDIAGFVATNTAADRQGLVRSSTAAVEGAGMGGLSGAPLRDRANALVRHIYGRVERELPIVGVGGIDSPEAAYERFRSGATLVQLYTGLVFEGPGLVARIQSGLLRCLERDGLSTLSEAIGTDCCVNP